MESGMWINMQREVLSYKLGVHESDKLRNLGPLTSRAFENITSKI